MNGSHVPLSGGGAHCVPADAEHNTGNRTTKGWKHR